MTEQRLQPTDTNGWPLNMNPPAHNHLTRLAQVAHCCWSLISMVFLNRLRRQTGMPRAATTNHLRTAERSKENWQMVGGFGGVSSTNRSLQQAGAWRPTFVSSPPPHPVITLLLTHRNSWFPAVVAVWRLTGQVSVGLACWSVLHHPSAGPSSVKKKTPSIWWKLQLWLLIN